MHKIRWLIRPPFISMLIMISILGYLGQRSWTFLSRAMHAQIDVIQKFQLNWQKNFKPRSFTSYQDRFGIHKQFWFRPKEHPSQLDLSAKSSKLHLNFDGKDLDIYEELEEINGLFKESDEANQTIRQVKSKHAIFDYKQMALRSQEVQLKIYRLAETPFIIPDINQLTPSLQGVAKKITIDLKADPPKFWAVRFSADLHQQIFSDSNKEDVPDTSSN